MEPNEKLFNRCKLWFGLRKEKEDRTQQETRKRAKTEDGKKKTAIEIKRGEKQKIKKNIYRVKIEYERGQE
jgi:hypothetical protein